MLSNWHPGAHEEPRRDGQEGRKGHQRLRNRCLPLKKLLDLLRVKDFKTDSNHSQCNETKAEVFRKTMWRKKKDLNFFDKIWKKRREENEHTKPTHPRITHQVPRIVVIKSEKKRQTELCPLSGRVSVRSLYPKNAIHSFHRGWKPCNSDERLPGLSPLWFIQT